MKLTRNPHKKSNNEFKLIYVDFSKFEEDQSKLEKYQKFSESLGLDYISLKIEDYIDFEETKK